MSLICARKSYQLSLTVLNPVPFKCQISRPCPDYDPAGLKKEHKQNHKKATYEFLDKKLHQISHIHISLSQQHTRAVQTSAGWWVDDEVAV